MSVCTAKSFDLTGKIALITGASYGIGFAIATAMANCGATIVFNDIKQELVDKGLAAYKEAGIDAHGYVCDVTDEDAVNASSSRSPRKWATSTSWSTTPASSSASPCAR